MPANFLLCLQIHQFSLIFCGFWCIFVQFLNLEGEFESIRALWEPLCVIFTFQARVGTSKRQNYEASRTPIEVQFESFLSKMHVFFGVLFGIWFFNDFGVTEKVVRRVPVREGAYVSLSHRSSQKHQNDTILEPQLKAFIVKSRLRDGSEVQQRRHVI